MSQSKSGKHYGKRPNIKNNGNRDNKERLSIGGDFAQWKEKLKAKVELSIPKLVPMFQEPPKDVTISSKLTSAKSKHIFVMDLENHEIVMVSLSKQPKFFGTLNIFKNMYKTYLHNREYGIANISDEELLNRFQVIKSVAPRNQNKIQFARTFGNGKTFAFNDQVMAYDKELFARSSADFLKENDLIEDGRKALTSMIVSSLSKDLLLNLSQNIEFKTLMKNNYDPLRLLNLVELVATNHLGMDEEDVQNELSADFHSMRQNSMTMSEYYDHYLKHMRKMEDHGLGGELPKGKRLVKKFAESLNRDQPKIKHFLIKEMYQTTLTNLEDLLDAYMKYEKHVDTVLKNPNNKRQLVTETAYAANGGNGPHKKMRGKRGKNNGGGDKAALDTLDGLGNNKTASSNNNRKPLHCWNCNGSHHRRDCKKPENKKLMAANFQKYKAGLKEKERGGVENDNDKTDLHDVDGGNSAFKSDLSLYFTVLLDSQASAHLFRNKELLHNIKSLSIPMIFNGISGGLSPEHHGSFLDFDNVYLDERCPANLLSLYRVAQDHEVEWDIDNGFILHLDNKMKIYFKPDPSGHYVARITLESVRNCVEQTRSLQKCKKKVFWYGSESAFVTVGELEAAFRPDQVKRAREAKELFRKLSYPSTQSLCKLLQSGGIDNCDLTPEDVIRSVKIYGPEIASLKGKTVSFAPPTIPPVIISNVAQSPITLYADIMFLNGDPYFISVSKPLNLTLVTHMSGSKSSSALKQCFESQYTLYAQRRFVVIKMVMDGDGEMSLKNEFIQSTVKDGRNVSIECVIGQHVAIIESRIRRIKERIRAHVSVLPFKLTKRSMSWLVIFVVHRYNCLPLGDQHDMMSPRQRFTGCKPNYKKDLQLGFGDYVQAVIPANQSGARNALVERTEGAIALYPTGNLGAWRFLLLKKRERGGPSPLVTRHHWVKLPLTIEVVERFEQLTEVEYSDDYHKQVIQQLDGNENIVEPFNNNSTVVDPIVEDTDDDTGQQVQLIPEVINMEPVAPNIDLDVEVVVDPIIPVVARSRTSRSGRSLARPERYRDPDFVTQFDHEYQNVSTSNGGVDDEVEMVNSNQMNNSEELVQFFADRQISIENELTESMEIMLAFVDPRETAFNMSVKAAISKWNDKAVNAIRDELSQMIEKQVWTAVNKSSIPRKNKIIPSFMFLKEKYLANGELDRIKARLVAGGHIQDLSP